MSTIKNSNADSYNVSIRPRGKSFCVVYHYHDENEKRRQKSETYHTEEAANKRKLELEYMHSVKKLVKPNDITFEQLFHRYMEFYAEANYKPNHFRNFRQQVELHILPEIGSMYIQDINPLDIERLMKKIRTKKRYYKNSTRHECEETLSSSTVASIFSAINKLFKQAVKWKLIMASPVECERPQVKNKEVKIWTPDQVQDALQAMRSDGKDMLELCIHTSYICSARKGEVAGLTFDDIDPVNCTVHIRKQLHRVDKDALARTEAREKPLFVFPSENEQSKSVLVLMSLKNKGSHRLQKVPRPFMDRLMERKREFERQKAVYTQLGTFSDYQLLISHPNGDPVDPRRMNIWLEKFLKKHSEFTDIVFHGVRHSSATEKVRLSGGDMKSVQAHTGHGTLGVLVDRYAHITRKDSDELTNKLEKSFYGSGVETATDQAALVNNVLALALSDPDVLQALKNLMKNE